MSRQLDGVLEAAEEVLLLLATQFADIVQIRLRKSDDVGQVHLARRLTHLPLMFDRAGKLGIDGMPAHHRLSLEPSDTSQRLDLCLGSREGVAHGVLAHGAGASTRIPLSLPDVQNALGLQAASRALFFWLEGECLIRKEERRVSNICGIFCDSH